MAGRRCKCSFSWNPLEDLVTAYFHLKICLWWHQILGPSWEGLRPPVRSTTLNNDLLASETWTSEIRDSHGQKEPLPSAFQHSHRNEYAFTMLRHIASAGAFIWKGNPPQILTCLEKVSKKSRHDCSVKACPWNVCGRSIAQDMKSLNPLVVFCSTLKWLLIYGIIPLEEDSLRLWEMAERASLREGGSSWMNFNIPERRTH